MNDLRLLLVLLAVAVCAPSIARAQGETVPPPDQTQPTPGQDQAQPPQALTPPPQAAAHERNCSDHVDDDGDGLIDCADADCFDAPECHAGGSEENTNGACADWVDNDGDGAVDCEDADCQTDSVTVCRGSWRGGAGGAGGATGDQSEELPELEEGQTLADLVGRDGDIAGERTDEACSDGIDNDLDGRIDCADVSCRFDPQVSVCTATGGIHFGIAVGIGASTQWNYDHPAGGGPETVTNESTARFSMVQLRALGTIPFIQNSFFLLSLRAEDTFRLTFALFQIPLSTLGHYIQLNSGSGNLSTGLIISAAYRVFLDPANYLYNRFEQGNGASIEIGGPIDTEGMLRFRVFGAAGSGQFNGSVGGGFFRADERNFAWTAGAQFQLNLAGNYNRLDSMMLYTPDPGTFAILAGAKYDQRPAERFVAAHAQIVAQYGVFMFRGESYTGFIMDDPSTLPIQTAFNAMVGVLVAPRLIYLAADVGGYFQPNPYSMGPPSDINYRSQRQLVQWRFSANWYFWRSTGWLAAVYREAYYLDPDDRPRQFEIERQVRLEVRFRY